MSRLLLFIFLLAGGLGKGQNLDQLKPLLLRFHPNLSEFSVVSSCQVDSAHAVAVIRGTVRPDRIERGAADPEFFRQEAFGVFVVDAGWKPLIQLDVSASRRWWDYTVRVEECPPGSAVVSSQGTTYGEERQGVQYFYDLRRRALINRIPDDPISIEWIEPLAGALYFIGPAVVARFDPSLPDGGDVTPIKDVLEVRRDRGTLVLLSETQRYELSGGRWLARPNPEQAMFSYNPRQPVPGLAGLQLWLPLHRVERNTVSLNVRGRAPRRFLVWNARISDNSFGGQEGSGVYEILAGTRRFFPLPQPDWESFRKLRPARVRDGYTRDSDFKEEVGPFQMVADRLWFGASFYDGEGTTGIGGLGWFDTVNRSFHMRHLPEIADWSASAIFADQHEVWLGLVRRPEGADIPGGLARVRLSDWTVTVHKVPRIVRVIRRVDGILYLGTSDGVYRIGPGGMNRIAIRRTADGGYRLAVEP